MPKIYAPEVPQGAKWCHQCQSSKPASAFYRSSRRPDGLNYCCKVCTAAARERHAEMQRIMEDAMREVREWMSKQPPKVTEVIHKPMSVW